MLKQPFHPGLYAILTDPTMGYEALTRILVDSGVQVIQLRMKDAPRSEVRACALSLRRLIPADRLFLLNDDPELAVEVGADGCHIGQDDMPYGDARRIMGDDAVIGISTHNPEQVRAACALHPDYIGVGPVFPTPTKKIPDPVLGLDTMEHMLRLATVPAVCIGGIDLDNVHSVLERGARNVCAVRAINNAADPGAVIAAFWEALKAHAR